MPSTHALLSPSAAHRWLHCTPSAVLEREVKDEGSDFALEGTLAHALAAKALKEYNGQDTTEEQTEINSLARFYSDEMAEYIDDYTGQVLQTLQQAKESTPDARLIVEQRLDLSEYIPEAFGTSDAIIIADGTLEVIDLKFGKGVRVEAEENPQMRIYALGALSEYAADYRIEKVRMRIVQPRLHNVSTYEESVESLTQWAAEVLKPKAKKAHAGEGQQTPGAHCQFCKIKTVCLALACKAIGSYNDTQNISTLTTEQIARHVLPFLPVIKKWASAVETYALQEALNGTRYEGFKIVEGRSIRKISDAVQFEKTLKDNGFDAITRTELLPLTELERVVGKKKLAELCGTLIVKPKGAPTLVPESDKRPEYNNAKDDFKDIQ